MKDFIKKIIFSLFFIAFLVYLLYLYFGGITITTSEYTNSNIAMYVILIIINILGIIFIGLYSVSLKLTRAIMFVVGIGLIYVGEFVLLNDPEQLVYIGDIVKIIGVVLLLLIPTKLFVTKKHIKQKKSKHSQVIEV